MSALLASQARLLRFDVGIVSMSRDVFSQNCGAESDLFYNAPSASCRLVVDEAACGADLKAGYSAALSEVLRMAVGQVGVGAFHAERFKRRHKLRKRLRATEPVVDVVDPLDGKNA